MQRSVVLPYKGVVYALENGITLPNHGGCFHQGPGFVSNKDMSLYDDGTLSFNGLNMFKTETYLAVVMVEKDTRRSTGGVYIDVVDGDPPHLAIR
ncbi:hypothetical protein LSH36_91g03086 [Paralvinella palmiformis]|uniref:Uncharacterized protein n=1 Tax=Paralvinella palmiformis TaxID=53620 RepID=A0AAD9K134_9ANNE|nr:hypothetical protein LSH36_91g03086 [Paralvinella palmiformis]